jgi:hypothetical protein
VVGIALDAGNLYYTTCQGLHRALMKVPVDGGTPELVASREQNGGLADDANVYWIAQAALLKAPISMVLDQFTAYWKGPTVMDSTNFYFNGGSDIGQVPRGGGALLTLASSQFSVGSIAVDGTSVYWSTETTIMKTPIGGGVESTLASDQVGGPFAIAVDATNVYWGAHGGTWSTARIDSGTPVNRTVLISGESQIRAMAVDSTNLYWTSDAVKMMPLGGGPARLVPGVNQYGPYGPLAVNGTDVVWVDQSSALVDHRLGASSLTLATHTFGGDVIAVDATHAYYIDDTAYPAAIMKVSLDGGLPVAVVSGSVQRTALVVDATSIYWTGFKAADAGLFNLMKTPLDGGPDVLVDPLVSGFGALALDATNLYWTTSDSVVTTPRTGGAVTTLASGESGPSVLTSDGTNVYFAVRDGVRKVPAKGGASSVIASGIGVQPVIAVDGASVYWATFDGTIVKSPK